MTEEKKITHHWMNQMSPSSSKPYITNCIFYLNLLWYLNHNLRISGSTVWVTIPSAGPSLTEFHSIDNETPNITETVLKLLTVMINMKPRQFLLNAKTFTEDNNRITKCQPLIYPMSYSKQFLGVRPGNQDNTKILLPPYFWCGKQNKQQTINNSASGWNI